MRRFQTIDFQGMTLDLYVGEYNEGGKVYVKAVHQGEDYCDVTVNLSGEPLEQGYAHISSDCPSDLLEMLEENEVCSIVGETPYNFGTYKLVFFNDLG